MKGDIKPMVELLRFPTFITAFADCAAGYALAGGTRYYPDLLWLAVASMSVYCFALVFNDVCDTEYDRIHYPERPLPSGKVSRGKAFVLAGLLLGICFASAIAFLPGSFRAYVAIAGFASAYDMMLKKSRILGSLNLALCRLLNFYAGFSAVGIGDFKPVFYGLLPAGHVFLLSIFSGFEERENRNGAAAVYIALLVFWILLSSFIESTIMIAIGSGYVLLSLLFAIRFLFLTWKPHYVTIFLVWGIVVLDAAICYSTNSTISLAILGTLVFSLAAIFRAKTAPSDGSR